MARMKVGPAGGATFSWYDSEEYAYPISLGNVCRKTSSRAASACPELKPRAGVPWISTERSRLNRVVISVPGTDVMVTGVESGIIVVVVWLRTETWLMSAGLRRQSAAAWTQAGE